MRGWGNILRTFLAHTSPPPLLQFVVIIWFSCSAIFLLRTAPASAIADDDDTAQAMLQPLNSMLNWGVANSDPEELKRIAKMVPSTVFAFLLLLHIDFSCSGARRYSASEQLRRQRNVRPVPHPYARHAWPQLARLQHEHQRARAAPGTRGTCRAP